MAKSVAVVGALWVVVVVVVLGGVASADRPYVVTHTMHTSASVTQRFRLSTWESSMSTFGVEADGDIHVYLIHPEDKRFLNISLKVSAYAGESQITGTGMGDPISIVSHDAMQLSLDEFNWFTIFRGRNLLLVYQERATRPFLIYYNNNTINVTDFMAFNTFQVSSLRNASWDFLGTEFEPVNATAVVPSGLENELDGVSEGVSARLNLLETFYRTHKLKRLKKANLKVLLSELYWCKGYAMLLFTYGRNISERNMVHTAVSINTMIYQTEAALTPGLRVKKVSFPLIETTKTQGNTSEKVFVTT